MAEIPKKITGAQPFEAKDFNISDQRARQASIINNREANYIIRGFNLQRLQSQFFKVPTQFEDDEHTSDKVPPEASFGLPVFTSLEFEGGQFKPLDGGVISWQPLRIDTVLMTVNMTKNIVTTAIQGRNGTVKEYASDGDYQINIRGVLAGTGQNEYPAIEVEALSRILTVPDTIKVTSEFLGRFGSISPFGVEGIQDVVVESFSFPQSEGFHNVQLFNINLLSDTPIELTI
jgi:hypothetical protein